MSDVSTLTPSLCGGETSCGVGIFSMGSASGVKMSSGSSPTADTLCGVGTSPGLQWIT